MADLTGIGSIIGGVGNFVTGIANTAVGAKYAQKNYELQRDMANYQKELNRTIMEREDNAVRRRSADIKAAGGNPALAYMNGVSAAGAGGSVSSPKAPQYDTSAIQQGISHLGSGFSSISQIEANILANKQRKAEIEKVDADISKTKAETLTETYRRLSIIEQTAKTRAEKERVEASKKELIHNLDWYISKDLPTNANLPSVMNYAHGFFHELGSGEMDAKDKLMLVSEVAGAAFIGTAGVKAIGRFINTIKSSPAMINRAYQYLKTHGLSGAKSNFDDFKDYVINGASFKPTDKEYKVNQQIPFGVKGYKK